MLKCITILLAIIMSTLLHANNENVTTAITQALQKSNPDLSIQSIQASPIDGLYAVQVVNGPILHFTADGHYMVNGDLFTITNNGWVNLSEQKRQQQRVDVLDQLNTDEMIIFAPEPFMSEKGESQATITVFTDVDCFYCQKLHNEIPELNQRGITVRYLAFPRAGIDSETYHKMTSAWCADDPKKAITTLKAKKSIATKTCPNNPVAKQFALGQSLGVQATPTIITDTGLMIRGYQPAAALAATATSK